MKVINLDRKGNVIPDMSKVVIPYNLSAEIWEILNPGRKARRKEGAASGSK